MANKRLLVAILVLSLVTFFATPMAAFAVSSAPSESIELTDEFDLVGTLFPNDKDITGLPGDVCFVKYHPDGSVDEASDGWTDGLDVWFEEDPTGFVEWGLNDDSIEIVGVFVKGGPGGYFYDYSGEEWPQGDSNLTTPPIDWYETTEGAIVAEQYPGLSHITFYFSCGEAPAEPELLLMKAVRLAGTQDPWADQLVVEEETVEVEYGFYVENTGDADLEDVTVYDQTLDWLSDPVDLAVGEDNVFTTTFSIGVDDWMKGDIFVNVATASGMYDGSPVYSDEDDATVMCMCTPPDDEADIAVTKEVRLSSDDDWSDSVTVNTKSSGTAYFKIVVTNTGDYELNSVVLEDAALDINYPVGTVNAGADYTTYASIDLIDIGSEWWVDDIFTNVATASGFYDDMQYTDDDDAMVEYEESITYDPAIGVDKTVSLGEDGPWAENVMIESMGEDVYFKIVVSNEGDVDLENVMLIDDALGIDKNIGTLTVGAIYTEYAWAYADEIGTEWWDGDVLTNVATASAIFGQVTYSDDDDATVTYNDSEVRTPDIQLTKTVDRTTVSSRNADVEYTFEVYNNGDYNLFEVYIYDEDLDEYFYFDGVLETGETFTTTFEFDLADLGTGDISDWDGNVFTNWATAYGYGDFQQEGVSDRDDATVRYRSGGGGGGGGGGGTTTVIDEPTPAAPAPVVEEVVLDQPIPAAPLPQTGGFDPLFLYGLGALLASGGAIMRRRGI